MCPCTGCIWNKSNCKRATVLLSELSLFYWFFSHQVYTKPKPDTYSGIISTYMLTKFTRTNSDFLFWAITVEDAGTDSLWLRKDVNLSEDHCYQEYVLLWNTPQPLKLICFISIYPWTPNPKPWRYVSVPKFETWVLLWAWFSIALMPHWYTLVECVFLYVYPLKLSWKSTYTLCQKYACVDAPFESSVKSLILLKIWKYVCFLLQKFYSISILLTFALMHNVYMFR